MFGRVFTDMKGIGRRKAGNDTIHELEWGQVTRDGAAPVCIQYLSNFLHSFRDFVMRFLGDRLLDGLNHSLCPTVTHRGVLSDGLSLYSVRLNELCNGGGGEAE